MKPYDAFRAWQKTGTFSHDVLADTGNADLLIDGPLHGFVYSDGAFVKSNGDGTYSAFAFNDDFSGSLYHVEHWLWRHISRETMAA